MNEIEMSVIVPVYKIKRHLLEECLDSLESQICNTVEFIIIDDGSPDECGKICDEYAVRDKRFVVLHTLNGGVSQARNIGLKKSKGKYILFVDGDDQVIENAINDLLSYARSHTSDILFFKHYFIDEANRNSRIQPKGTNTDTTLIALPDIAAAIISHTERLLNIPNVAFGAPWGKVYSADFLKRHQIEFPPGIKKTQDRIFVTRALSFNPNYCIIDYFGYIYIENDNSICRNYNPQIITILDDAANCFYNTIERFYSGEVQDKLKKAYNYLQASFMFSVFRIDFFNHKHLLSEANDWVRFRDYCKSKRQYIVNCLPVHFTRKKALVLILLRFKAYRITYFFLTYLYKLNFKGMKIDET